MSAIGAPQSSPKSLKRDHDEFSEHEIRTVTQQKEQAAAFSRVSPAANLSNLSLPGFNSKQNPATAVCSQRNTSPAPSSAGSLTEAGTTTPSAGGASPVTAFSMLNGTAQLPPIKKAKMTFQEKQFQEAIKEAKRREKADEKARKDAEKAQKDVEKLRRDAEREAERVKKEAEREQKRLNKEAENAEKEKAKQAREAEKRKREEEKQKIEEEKQKKERSQPKLNAFFGNPKASSKEVSPAPFAFTEMDITLNCTSKTGGKPEYDKIFPPFFIKEHVALAPVNRFEIEQWGADNVEEEIDAYLEGKKTLSYCVGFDAATLFNCPDLAVFTRGRRILPVRDIMTDVPGHAGRPLDLTTNSQNAQIRNTHNLLSKVPFKIIAFSQDVRPPYYGTHTRYSLSQLKKLARRPTTPQLKDLQYEYDSEAEWVEDGDEEDAEDLMSELGDDEEDDVDHDLDGFVDDEDDPNVNKRAELPADQQPKCSGLCFENHERVGPNLRMYGYHMEIMHDDLGVKAPIDPFASHYWESPVSTTRQGLMEPPRLPLTAMKGTNPIVNRPIPMKKIIGISDVKATSTTAPRGLVSNPEDIKVFREEVEGNDLSKVGLIEVVHKKMAKATKAQVKASIEAWAQYVGAKRADKRWRLTESCPT